MNKGCMFIVALVLGVLSHNAAFAAEAPKPGYGAPMQEAPKMRPMQEAKAGNIDPGCEYQSGPCTCYCPVTKYNPCYYTVKHCVKEPYTVQKQCCRMVPQYCEKQCCRYVPQYYTKTTCKYVPEYYCVPVQKCREKVVCEQKCRYVPCTYMKKITCECPPQACEPACPPSCAPVCR